MKVYEIIQFQKFLLNIFNAFFVILGVSIFGCAAWILFDKNSLIAVISSEGDVELVAVSLALIGLVVVVVSVIGCAGGQLESKCLLLIYMGFIIIITFGQTFVTFVLLLRRAKIEEFLVNTVNEEIKLYGNTTENHASWTLLDRIQHSAKCCGRHNMTDWDQNTFIQSLGKDNVYPCSCFNTTCPNLSVGGRFGEGTTDIYKEGCQKRLTSWLEDNIAVIIGMNVGLIVVQVIQVAFAVCIYQNIGRKMRQKNPKNLIGSMEVDPQMEGVHQNPDYYDQPYHQQDSEQQQYQQQQYLQQDHQQQQYPQQDHQQQDYQQQQYQDYQQQQYLQLDHQQQQYLQQDHQQQQYPQQDHQLQDYQQQQYHQQQY
ncbi:tetraspanin-19 isoform X1 [Alosa sapidissima]|uniref:tetraspanin-19 isoform X1 n=1 Tax=Alosa sapidissima TaxID=34773 RepID=UPI001C0A5E97|nr:tetraspanin-19 isoform X1 [Alosa sapidissima]XP_041933982.1 tetraspanin-19 isoform X1 [Alosa sapidissima]